MSLRPQLEHHSQVAQHDVSQETSTLGGPPCPRNGGEQKGVRGGRDDEGKAGRDGSMEGETGRSREQMQGAEGSAAWKSDRIRGQS